MTVKCCIALIFAVLWHASPVLAQSRADIARQQRAEKAQKLQPYPRNAAERILFMIEDTRLVERVFNPPNGAFLRVGGLPQGSGMPLGPGYRISNDKVSLMGYGVMALVPKYWDVGTELSFNHLLNHRAFVVAGARRMNLPQEDFFGIGITSSEATKTSYALKQNVFHVRGGNALTDRFRVLGRLQYETPEQGPGEDSRIPSIEEVFTPAQAPGLFDNADFLRTGFTVTADLTDRPVGIISGGLYSFGVERFADRDLDKYSFNQWTVDLRQFVPVVPGARTLAVRLFATGVSPDEGHDVPYYYLPTLGGAYMVRGLANYRFRDRNVAFVNVEYRYELNAFMSGVLFYDAGTVAPTFNALSMNNLQWDYGFGVRFGFMGAATIRTELSFGAEGPRLVFKFSDIF